MHGEARLTGRGPAPDDRAGHSSRSHLVELHAVLDGTSGHDDNDLAGTRAQGTREVLGIGAGERCALFGHLRGVDEEAGHGSMHGAAPASRYGGAVSETRLTAYTADGLALSVVVDGEGDPLLLIPGLGAGRSAFHPIVADLARHHRVITFDPRGIGESQGGGTVTLPAMALDAVAVLDAAGVHAAAVFGASMGGLIAQHMVGDHPDRVAHLILAATAPGGDSGVDSEPADQAKLLGTGARTPEDAYRIACTVLYSGQFQRAHPEFIEAQIRERAQHPVRPRVFSAQFAAMRQPDNSFQRLAAVTAPTLVLHGTEDVVTPFENARILARRIPGAELRPFEGCGHLFFHERPAETARVVTEHLPASASDVSQGSSEA
jgi:3-oxoadipate enol-lactonase